MKPTYRLAVAAALTLALSGAPALAQTYPDHTIEWVVPYQAGGGTDIVARSVAEKMSKSLGQSRSEEHTSELQSLMRISYAVFCLKKKNKKTKTKITMTT